MTGFAITYRIKTQGLGGSFIYANGSAFSLTPLEVGHKLFVSEFQDHAEILCCDRTSRGPETFKAQL